MLREEVEVCPFCDSENVIQWDVEKDGYKTTCRHCGRRLMLCDACFHSEDNEGQYCDWFRNDEFPDGICFRMCKKPKLIVEDGQ